jgi:hypothetical protein
LAIFFQRQSYAFFDQKWLGHLLVDFFTNSSGHPDLLECNGSRKKAFRPILTFAKARISLSRRATHPKQAGGTKKESFLQHRCLWIIDSPCWSQFYRFCNIDV